ncbi:MAG: hypothetical protein HZB19_16275 [Chloroflexi bacterium]|nr:hypothetical protein [Chloroflexota bacterium]
MSAELSKIRFVAANYSRLQGLREVPVGMLVVFVSIWAMYNHGPTADLTAPFLAAFGAALLYWLIGRYYNRVFGRVKQTRQQLNREIIASVVFSLLALLAFWLDAAMQIPVCALGLVFAAALFENFWRATESVRSKAAALFPENLAAAIVILIISILPLFGISWWEFFGLKSQVVSVFMVIGVVIILAGIWGHLRILRALPMMEAKTNDHPI